MPPELLSFFDDLRSLDYLPFVFSILLGGAVGLERELHGRPAGVRTHIIVCLSATMLIMVSRHVADADSLDLGGAGRIVFDPNRMGAGIVTGIGFLGAATVIRSGDFLRGLTTAACIWYVAGLGVVLGTGHYAVGTAGTLIVLLVLVVVNQLAHGIRPVIYRRLVVVAQHREVQPLVDEIKKELRKDRIRLLDIGASADAVDGINELTLFVSLKNRLQAPGLVERVARLEGVRQARWRAIARSAG